jgi:hypothetical protein
MDHVATDRRTALRVRLRAHCEVGAPLVVQGFRLLVIAKADDGTVEAIAWTMARQAESALAVFRAQPQVVEAGYADPTAPAPLARITPKR